MSLKDPKDERALHPTYASHALKRLIITKLGILAKTPNGIDTHRKKRYNTEQGVSLKKIIVESYRAVGSLNDSFQSSNFMFLLLFFIDFGQF